MFLQFHSGSSYLIILCHIESVEHSKTELAGNLNPQPADFMSHALPFALKRPDISLPCFGTPLLWCSYLYLYSLQSTKFIIRGVFRRCWNLLERKVRDSGTLMTCNSFLFQYSVHCNIWFLHHAIYVFHGTRNQNSLYNFLERVSYCQT